MEKGNCVIPKDVLKHLKQFRKHMDVVELAYTGIANAIEKLNLSKADIDDLYGDLFSLYHDDSSNEAYDKFVKTLNEKYECSYTNEILKKVIL